MDYISMPSLATLVSAVSVLSCVRHTHSITEADDRYTDTTTVSVGNEFTRLGGMKAGLMQQGRMTADCSMAWRRCGSRKRMVT